MLDLGIVPDGYIAGMDRCGRRDIVTHLYKGTFSNPGLPMCSRGWNRDGQAYSIFRGNISDAGLCKICLRRALENRPGVRAKRQREDA